MHICLNDKGFVLWCYCFYVCEGTSSFYLQPQHKVTSKIRSKLWWTVIQNSLSHMWNALIHKYTHAKQSHIIAEQQFSISNLSLSRHLNEAEGFEHWRNPMLSDAWCSCWGGKKIHSDRSHWDQFASTRWSKTGYITWTGIFLRSGSPYSGIEPDWWSIGVPSELCLRLVVSWLASFTLSVPPV